MSSNLQAVQIERFKAISNAPFDLGPLNVLVGANNSGKSSIIQGLHFGIGLLQTIELSGNWTNSDSISTSINPTQLIYSPSEDVNALAMGGKLLEAKESAITFRFTLGSGEKPSVSVRKGRNRNILVSVDNATAARRLASLESPFSVFSPGLAGISKTEHYVSDGVLLRTIARGDANLVLRNILLRLWNTPNWDPFLADLREIFPYLEFDVTFQRETDEFISVNVRAGKEWIPLELSGTGVLQATQILAYIHRFSPSIVVLDEPDSHLHPNNQRLLCALLRKVAEERSTQILLTTHSRYVVDAIGGSVKFLWVRNKTVEPAGPDDEIGVLLDIGALDVKERVAQPNARAIVLTEDENIRSLSALLASSNFAIDETIVLPYYGVSTIKQLRPLVQTIQKTNPNAKIVVHRDRDYLTDEEAADWEAKVTRLRVEPFITTGVDIESHWLNSKHLSEINQGVSQADFDRLIKVSMESLQDESVQHYVNGRIEIARKKGTYPTINHGQLAVEATKQVAANLGRYSHGKSVIRKLKANFQKEFRTNLKDAIPSPYASVPTLETIAKKVFGTRRATAK